MLNYYKDFEKYLQHNGLWRTNTSLINTNQTTSILTSLDNYSNFKFSLKYYKHMLKQYLQRQNPNDLGRLFYNKFIDNDDNVVQGVLKRWLPIYTRRRRGEKLTWFNKFRVKVKMKIMRKWRYRQEHNSLYYDYQYKDQYLNYLKMVNTLKESLECTFRPRINKNRTVIKYYINTGWQAGDDSNWNRNNKSGGYRNGLNAERKSNKLNRSLSSIYFEPVYYSGATFQFPFPKHHRRNTSDDINRKREMNKSNSVQNMRNSSVKCKNNLIDPARRSLNDGDDRWNDGGGRGFEGSGQGKLYNTLYYLRKDNPSNWDRETWNKIPRSPYQTPSDIYYNSYEINYNAPKLPNNKNNNSHLVNSEHDPYTEGLLTERFKNRKNVLNISDSNTKLNEDDCYVYLIKNHNSGHSLNPNHSHNTHASGINTYNNWKKNHAQDSTCNNNSSYNNYHTKEISELSKSNSLPVMNVNTSKHQKNKSSIGSTNNNNNSNNNFNNNNSNFNVDINKNDNTNHINQLIVDTGQFSLPPSYPQITHVTLQTMTDAKYWDIANRYVSTDESWERFKAISTRGEQNKK